MAGLNVQPKNLDLALYAGDGIKIRFTCRDKTGAPVDITGSVNAQIRKERTTDPPVTEFSANLVDAYQGIFILSLTGDQTRELLDSGGADAVKFLGAWDVQWTPNGAEPYTVCQGKVECVLDVTR